MPIRIPTETDLVVLNTEEHLVAVSGNSYDEEYGTPANLWVGICDLEYGNFSFYTDNGIDFTVWDPE